MDFRELREREHKGLMQAANEIGIAYQSLYRYENQGRVPKKEILLKMQQKYKCTDAELGEAIIRNLKFDGGKQNERKN
jgi:transcriptional regulator with XRE-family HTH domain